MSRHLTFQTDEGHMIEVNPDHIVAVLAEGKQPTSRAIIRLTAPGGNDGNTRSHDVKLLGSYEDVTNAIEERYASRPPAQG